MHCKELGAWAIVLKAGRKRQNHTSKLKAVHTVSSISAILNQVFLLK